MLGFRKCLVGVIQKFGDFGWLVGCVSDYIVVWYIPKDKNYRKNY